MWSTKLVLLALVCAVPSSVYSLPSKAPKREVAALVDEAKETVAELSKKTVAEGSERNDKEITIGSAVVSPKPTAASSTSAAAGVVVLEDDRPRRSPHHFFFQVIDIDKPFGDLMMSDGNEVPFEARDLFTPPYPKSKEERHSIYSAQLKDNEVEGIGTSHAFFIVMDEPFFDEFDHAKAVHTLQDRRKRNRLPQLFFKSLRPFFPFFSQY